MKKFIILSVLTIIAATAQSQTTSYTKDWNSIGKFRILSILNS